MHRSLWMVAAAGLLLVLAAGLGASPAPAAAYPTARPGSSPPATTVTGPEAGDPATGGAGPQVVDTPTLTPCVGGTTFLNRAITASDTPLPNRVSQNGVASVCGTNKVFTGSIPATGRHFDQYTLTNNSTQSQCITVTLIDNGCGTNRAIMSAAYFGSFDPNNIATNYRADLGASVNAGTPQGVYSFDVPAFQQFVIVVYDIGTVTDCTNYTLRVDGCLAGPGPSPTPTNTPTPIGTPTLTPCAGSTTFLNRAIAASDTPLPNRVSQNGVASVCGTNKVFTGSIPATGRHFDQYTLTNNSTQSQCITVTLIDNGCGVNRAIMSAAYFGSFDPNNIATNYRADLGSSVNASNPQGVYSFDVPAFQQFVIIVYDIGTVTDCTNYTLRVDGCLSGPGPSPTPTPSPTPIAPVLIGHVTWQGRPAQPNAANVLPLTLMLERNGTTTTYANLTSDASGFFTVPVTTLPAGVYTWWTKGPSWLAATGPLNLSGAPVTQQEMGQQRAGDVNNDNLVDVTDFALLRATFGKACGDAGYDSRADFTGDCLVDVTDFALLRGNFGQAGPPSP